MKKYHINYSHNKYLSSQEINSNTAISIGEIDESIRYGYKDLDSKFIENNSHILNQRRGAGYWIWKPYIILKTLKKINDGDILFYTDSGCSFIKSINPLLEELETSNSGILLFELNSNFTNNLITKRDCFFYMGMDEEPYLSEIQILASFIIMKKNEFVVNFIEEWLKFSQDYRIITDSPNECGLPNYDGFVDHRHDQSILSLLGRKYGIKTIPDISQYGNDRRSSDKQIINHNRS
jgi:hypothetical protein